MSDVFCIILLALLAAYGVWSAFDGIYTFFVLLKDRSNILDYTIVINVINDEEYVENAIRKLVLMFSHKYCGVDIPRILIADYGSSDHTKEIALKLSGEYSFVQYIDMKNILRVNLITEES